MPASTTARPYKRRLPTGADPASVRQRIDALERVLEKSITIPGLGRRVGLDAVAGLVPVAGDAIGAVLGLYIVWEARRLGMPRWKLARMLANVALDTAVGAVPVAGDLFDFLFRSNSMNLKILRRHMDRYHPASMTIEG